MSAGSLSFTLIMSNSLKFKVFTSSSPACEGGTSYVALLAGGNGGIVCKASCGEVGCGGLVGGEGGSGGEVGGEGGSGGEVGGVV